MSDPEFRDTYDAMEEEFAIAASMIDARINEHMTHSANDVFKKYLSAEQRQKAKVRSEELIAEYKTLQKLRCAGERG